MSWSYRITALYLGFVTLILTLVIICTNHKVELVSKDYYQQELKYQDRINAIANSNALEKNIQHLVTPHSIELQLPAQQIGKSLKGEIQFYCPANSANDVNLAMEFDTNGKQFISKLKLNKGAYKLRLLWNCEGKNYFKEEIIVVDK